MSVPPLSVNGSFSNGAIPVIIEPSRVLSIQSHVCSGYVGNKAATFPLQLLGWDVDVVNTVQFSNHTGYGHTAGTKTTPEDLTAIFSGLCANGLLKAGRLLTGYIPGGEAVQRVGELARKLRDDRAGLGGEALVYVLDPVMGDHGTLYVADSVIPIYRSLLSLATVITPNQFEAETLADLKVTSLASLHALLKHLHITYSLPHIIITSFTLPAPASSALAALDLPAPPQAYLDRLAEVANTEGTATPTAATDWRSFPLLTTVASSIVPGSTAGELDTTLFAFPQIPGYFSGVGDLFSALTTAHFQPVPSSSSTSPLASAASKALFSTQQILLSTHLRTVQDPDVEGSDEEGDKAMPGRRVRRMRGRELGIVGKSARKDLEDGGEWGGKKVDLLA